jgi:hypothetical protein
MEEKEQIEVVNETIIPSLVEFILSNKFSSTIEEFLELNCSHFKFLEESKGDDDLEWSHVHKKIYDEYQAVADNLFDDFAAKNKVSLHCIQSCCTDVGKFWQSVSTYGFSMLYTCG